ncbi:MAG: TIGR04076 family protein [Deltaproteobacteria bacterium]|nr:TIGR04076 family protein [Deltaproteobacteria bacterium]MBW2044341.1 TIGR04076 family protein [Deltaproteobacteria bacterium]MBW2301274.1 TIGR04076 family protein [Deltaproteobacteria bacterium]
MAGEKEGIGIYHRPKVPMYRVRVTVIKAHPDCGAQHKVGDTWEISHVKEGGQKGFLCPSALHDMYHIIFAMRYGAQFPWAEDPDTWIAQCGDPNTPMLFKIERMIDEVWTADQDQKEET